MEFASTFTPLALGELSEFAAERKRDGWRFVQILATKTEEGFDLVYSFMKDGRLENFVMGIQKDAVVPSITEHFLAAFVFENEIHDLFGVTVKGIAIDFGGNFYKLAKKEPMTIMSPAQKAARDKAAKLAAAKAAKAKESAAADKSAGEGTDAALEAKLANMDPEKAAKVRAAMEAKAKAQAAKKAEDKLAGLDPEKAAKVRAALEAKAAKEKAKAQEAKTADAKSIEPAPDATSSASNSADEEVE